jgi:integrase
MALSDTQIRNAKPKAKPYKLGDTGGLFVLVQPSGGKLWRLKYRIGGKEKKLALGTYPEISLSDARARRDVARKQLAKDVDPAIQRRRDKEASKAAYGNTFALIADELLAKRGKEGVAPATLKREGHYLTKLSAIAAMPVSDVEPGDVLASLRKVEANGTLETARRTLQFASRVFRYAVATTRLRSDPTRDLKGALTAPKVSHYGAITDAVRAGELLRSIEVYHGAATTLYALKIAPHVFVRPGELRFARWPEIDFEAKVWTIPAERMKMGRPHSIPLSRQVIALLQEVREKFGREGGFVIPGALSAGRPMSENTLGKALRTMGYARTEMTAHGFRAMASTLLNEARDPKTKAPMWKADAIERALAHADGDGVRAAYHRGAHWEERVEMAQWWSDYLDRLRKGADIVPILPQAKGAA